MGTIVDTVGCGVVVDGYRQMDCLAGQHDNDTVAGWLFGWSGRTTSPEMWGGRGWGGRVGVRINRRRWSSTGAQN